MNGTSMIKTAYFDGGEVHKTAVSVEISKGIGWHLLGLPDEAVKTTLLRVVTALQAIGCNMPGKRVIISVEPVEDRKANFGGFDLPIAVAILDALGKLPQIERKDFYMADFYFWGELGLDGSIRPAGGEAEIIDSVRDVHGIIVCSETAGKVAKMPRNFGNQLQDICVCNSLQEIRSYCVEHYYRGIEIKPLTPKHLLYRTCGDRWEFYNPVTDMLYMHPTIEECCKDIDRLADCALIEALPLLPAAPDYEYMNY